MSLSLIPMTLAPETGAEKIDSIFFPAPVSGASVTGIRLLVQGLGRHSPQGQRIIPKLYELTDKFASL